MNENNNNSNNNAPWYVMCHLNPRQIDLLLTKECEGKFCHEGEPPAPFRFYIPFLYMPVAENDGASDYTNDLRGDFHNFVFIQATAARLGRLVASDWNVKSRLHLYHYRDHEGKAVIVADGEVRRLMATFRDQTLRFFIGQPIDEFNEGDRVIFNTGSWAGQHGTVKDIRLRKGQLTMTISMNIFNRTKSINFTGLRTGDITFVDSGKEQLLTGNPIDRFEEETVDLLSRRFGHAASKEMMQSDAERLRHLATFDRLYMEEDDADYARLQSLRLICAVLRQNKRQKEALQRAIEARLAQKAHPTTPDEAYQMTALFVATRQAHYRDAAKAYRNTHPDSPDILRRFHSIVKKMKAKKPQDTP